MSSPQRGLRRRPGRIDLFIGKAQRQLSGHTPEGVSARARPGPGTPPALPYVCRGPGSWAICYCPTPTPHTGSWQVSEGRSSGSSLMQPEPVPCHPGVLGHQAPPVHTVWGGCSEPSRNQRSQPAGPAGHGGGGSNSCYPHPRHSLPARPGAGSSARGGGRPRHGVPNGVPLPGPCPLLTDSGLGAGPARFILGRC